MKRLLNNCEKNFIKMLLNSREENIHLLPYLSKCLVEEMDDGGMSGLHFCSTNKDRYLGKKIADFNFTDKDGVPVSVSLNIDNYGDLYELDIWKVDFSPLEGLPNDYSE